MLKPWIIIKILAGHHFNEPIWERYIVWDWSQPRIAEYGAFKDQYLFDASSEHKQSITGPCPMAVPPNRIMCQFQHDETGRIVESTLDKHPGERWYLISFPADDFPLPTQAEQYWAKIMDQGGQL